jgi:excisionase family DNA binding protein
MVMALDGKWLTVQEAELELGVTGGYIRRMLINKRLPGEKMGGNWVIAREVVDAAKSTMGSRSKGRSKAKPKAKKR